METLDVVKLVDSIFSFKTWIVLIIVSIFGLLGGLSHKLTAPSEDKTPWWSYSVVGIVASLAILFVFAPSDPVRLIALSLAAGYGGKAVLDALKARVEVAITKTELVTTKENGGKAVEVGTKLGSIAQKLQQANKELENALIKATALSRDAVFKTLTVPLPADLQSFLAKPPEATANELNQLIAQLNILGRSFQK